MYNKKNYVTADEAVSLIRSGSHIHLGSIVQCAEGAGASPEKASRCRMVCF